MSLTGRILKSREGALTMCFKLFQLVARGGSSDRFHPRRKILRD